MELIIDVVEQTVLKFPDNVALIQEDNNTRASYTELMKRANAISEVIKTIPHFSSERDIFKDKLVCVMTERGMGLVISILAILKSGSAYIPIDPSFPSNRQVHMFNHSKTKILIVDYLNFAALKDLNVSTPENVIVIDPNTGEILEQHLQNNSSDPAVLNPLKPTGNSASYVLYTSGSTGKPKGVVVLNKGVVNIVQYFVDRLKVTPSDRILGLTTFCFDISVLEMFLPLFVGAALVLTSTATQKNPYKIVKVLKQHNVTIMQATPTTYEMVLSTGWNGNKNIAFLVGGEACRPSISPLVENSRGLYNVYGPTETTIWSSCYDFPQTKNSTTNNQTSDINNAGNSNSNSNSDVDSGSSNNKAAGTTLVSIPVGKPISQTVFYLVDSNMKVLSGVEEEGELLIGGIGVAQGYLHAPDITAQRFIKDPTGNGEIVYCTGDVVRRLSDGNYLFVRRIDDQIKINGYRIELAEIEVVIANHDTVKQAVVIVRNEQLIGYVKLHSLRHLTPSEELSTEKLLLEHTAAAVPSYMVPKHLIIMQEFPQTANGKLDKNNLPDYVSPAAISNIGVDAAMHSNVNGSNNNTDTTIALNFNQNHLNGNKSMLSHITTIVETLTGRRPHPTATFGAIGIDSLTALLFRNYLSQSLGGVKVDLSLLYDADTTIETFSVYLFDKLSTGSSGGSTILKTLKITTAIDNNLDNNNNNSINNNNAGISDGDETLTEKQELVSTAMLANRRLLEGLRGYLAVLVLVDHFFYQHPNEFGYRINCDTFMYILLTGFTITLQEIVNTSQHKNGFNFYNFITSKFIGLFPMYYLAIVFYIPQLIIEYNNDDLNPLTPSQYPVEILLILMGLQTWGNVKWNTALVAPIYYVSDIWSVFLVYGAIKFIYHYPIKSDTTNSNNNRGENSNSNNNSNSYVILCLKYFGMLCIVGFVAGMYAYAPTNPAKIIAPPISCVYFLVGVVTAHVAGGILSWSRSPSNSETAILPTGNHKTADLGLNSGNLTEKLLNDVERGEYNSNNNSNNNNSRITSNNKSNNNSVERNNSGYIAPMHIRQSTDKTTVNTLHSNKEQQNDQLSDIDEGSYSSIPDSVTYLAANHAVAKNNNGGKDVNETEKTMPTMLLSYAPIVLLFLLNFSIFYNTFLDKNNADGYDFAALYFLSPLIFCALITTSLMQSKQIKSIWTLYLLENKYIVLLGECSLAIYIFQCVLIDYWYFNILNSIVYNQNAFTTDVSGDPWGKYGSTWNGYVLYALIPGVLFAVLVSIFIQKYFQEKFVAYLHIQFIEWKQRRRMAAIAKH